MKFNYNNGVIAHFKVLQIIKKHGINLARIESRPSRTADWDYDFFIDMLTGDLEKSSSIVAALQGVVKNVTILGTGTAMVKGAMRYSLLGKSLVILMLY
jgi:phenylalanine-4-hydroxylase